MEVSVGLSFVAILISACAAIFAGSSAKAAKEANKFNRIETLAPHFINIIKLLRSFEGYGITKEGIENAKHSLEHLEKHYKKEDTNEIGQCLNAIQQYTQNCPGYRKNSNDSRHDLKKDAPNNINEINEYFEKKLTEL